MVSDIKIITCDICKKPFKSGIDLQTSYVHSAPISFITLVSPFKASCASKHTKTLAVCENCLNTPITLSNLL